ncbi:cobalt-precorrin-5B (C(1))-methyltransferase CbiD [Megasphaera sp.]|uniref:cobalt-precorrin-5B (C(1))-methyltransferase CbiD n=2 Tax=Megasphaera TaxID=906 RepID=UPI0025DF4126|nr:cobalt-precorrin-5B (C(1))-methyltransferase CbiD [uncultured Megasphaera sp.]
MYTIKDGKKLRCGYTTGSCAAAAAKAAAVMVLSGRAVAAVSLQTPQGTVLHLQPEDISFQENKVTCAIRKDSGDDPDITDGMLVYATVEKTASGLEIVGGQGVGRVTKPGLACAVGDWAINPVPRRMIYQALEDACGQCHYDGGLKLTLSLPDGERLAKKTFNPRLGIVGGLSILGTSGIVDPMSEQALVDTIHTEMDSRRAAGETHLLCFFGNYGVDFSRDTLGLDVEKRVTISNYVGESLDYAVYKGFSDVLLIGHIGKLVKVAQGIMNTHSRYADGRTTLLALEAVFAGASREIARQIYESLTTDEAVRILQENHLLQPVMTAVCAKIESYMDQRTHGEIGTAAIVFSNACGVLGQTSRARELLAFHKKGESR